MWQTIMGFGSNSLFMPHGQCFLWIPEILWLHVLSDAIIALSYFSIPFMLLYFALKRPDLPFRWMFLLFGCFIVFCGTSHVMGMVTIWYPLYWLDGMVKASTAVVSFATAALLLPLLPRALAVPGPAELRAYNNSLESQVTLRTQELAENNALLSEKIAALKIAENQLQLAQAEALQARDVAEQANHAKSAFLANMSHELRTPLNGILGYAQILADDERLDQAQQRGIEVVRRSGDYLLTLINDVLDLSKIEAGRLELDPHDFDCEEFLYSIVEPFRLQAEQKGIDFHFEQSEPLPPVVHGDTRRLRQILINLLGNAIKFTPQGQVSLGVMPLEGQLQFVVQDSGIGVPQEEQEQIFEPFRQSGDTSQQQSGTGLGLSISRRLVTLMGGSLTLHSAEQQGSTFTVTVPLPVSNQPVSLAMAERRRILGYQGKRRTILVADDNPDNCDIIRQGLSRLGFDVIVAENGRQALDLCQQQAPDLVLMDMVMPVLDGLAATRLLKADPFLAAIPVIIASASAFDYHRARSREAGSDGFITKPLRFTDLLLVLEKHLVLEWNYAEEVEPPVMLPSSDTTVMTASSPARPPPLTTPEIQRLQELALYGNAQGLKKLLSQLQQQYPEHGAWIQQLTTLANCYDLEAISTLLEPLSDAQDFQS